MERNPLAIKQFKLPDPGEGLVEAEIVEWKVKVGDTVEVNDIIVEVETAKSLVELPVPWSGTVQALLVEVGQTVDVGVPIIAIDDGEASDEPAAPVSDVAAVAAGAASDGGPQADGADEEVEAGKIGGVMPGGRVAVLVGYGPRVVEAKRRARKGASPAAGPVDAAPMDSAPAASPTQTASQELVDNRPVHALAKPPVRKLAKDNGVELRDVPATGDGGIVTREDLTAYLKSGKTFGGQQDSSSDAPLAAYQPPIMQRQPGERETRVPIKGVRKVTAQAMVNSAFTAPHVTEWITFDVSATMELVDKLKADKAFREVKVTPLLILAKAMCIAAKRHPAINSAWDEQAGEIVIKHYVNLGIAAATPRGLMVPNIKDADQLALVDLAAAINQLTATAREGKTQPAEMSGGTMTITNVGVFGVDTGTPILNPGEAAIMAFGAVRRQPWVVTDAAGHESIAPRWVTTLGLSFDHRLVDGELGSLFLADVAALMADPSKAFVWL